MPSSRLTNGAHPILEIFEISKSFLGVPSGFVLSHIICPLNSINLAIESKSTYAYKFKICGYGGKYTIGTISNETAIYWFELGDGLLERFISTYDREVIIEKYSIPEKYHENLGWSWTDFSDISDAYGPFLEIGSRFFSFRPGI